MNEQLKLYHRPNTFILSLWPQVFRLNNFMELLGQYLKSVLGDKNKKLFCKTEQKKI